MSRGIDVLTYAAAKAYTDKKVDEGGGGGGPTVVQTTGQSTSDVMSQKAVTDIIGDVESALNTINNGGNS